jgi:hypothetical protein
LTTRWRRSSLASTTAFPASSAIHVPQDWRDEATRKLREPDELLASEGRAHAFYRGRRHRPELWLGLPEDCREVLARWRERAESDPTASEPHVRRLERREEWTTGRPAFG